MQEDQKPQELKDPTYELFIVAITLLATANLIIILITPNEEMDDVLRIVNLALSLIFFGDFLYRLISASNKRDYVFKQWGWLDFLGSLPFMGMKIFRLLRAIRIIRLMMEYGRKALSEDLQRNRAGSALASASLLVILVLQFGSYFIVGIESTSTQANITTPLDALWWSVVTIATVGYGDKYPVTIQGRLLGTVVILSGVILFTVFTGFFAKKFFSTRESDEEFPLHSEIELEKIQNLVEEQSAVIAALQEQMTRIEQQLNHD